jgi:hypothetical protein
MYVSWLIFQAIMVDLILLFKIVEEVKLTWEDVPNFIFYFCLQLNAWLIYSGLPLFIFFDSNQPIIWE